MSDLSTEHVLELFHAIIELQADVDDAAS